MKIEDFWNKMVNDGYTITEYNSDDAICKEVEFKISVLTKHDIFRYSKYETVVLTLVQSGETRCFAIRGYIDEVGIEYYHPDTKLVHILRKMMRCVYNHYMNLLEEIEEKIYFGEEYIISADQYEYDYFRYNTCNILGRYAIRYYIDNMKRMHIHDIS